MEQEERAEAESSSMIGVVCSQDLKARIEAMAKKDHRSVSQWCRLKLEEIIVREEQASYGATDEAG